MKILDCTLRDGGYYTGWDFEETTVTKYLEFISNSPFAFCEVGYVNPITYEGYHGKYFNLRKIDLTMIRSKFPRVSIAVMIDLKMIESDDQLKAIIQETQDYVDLYRFTCNPHSLDNIKPFFKVIRKLKIRFAVNLMYANEIKFTDKFQKDIIEITNSAEYVYLVDSHGCLTPIQTKILFNTLKKILPVSSLGFHGHNNLELALANTLAAIENGAEIVDSTILGMGRGAGNLKTELLLIYLNKYLNEKEFNSIKFEDLAILVEIFESLQKSYNWGTNLPYAYGAINGIAQKDTMRLLSQKRFSYQELIIQQKKTFEVKKNNPISSIQPMENILIIGGGNSFEKIEKYKLTKFLNRFNNKANFIFCLNFKVLEYLFTNLENKLENVYFVPNIKEISSIKNLEGIKGVVISEDIFVEMNSDVEDYTITIPKELLSYKHNTLLNCLCFLLQNKKLTENVFAIGLDGYPNNYSLSEENNQILDYFYAKKISITSLTPTIYNSIGKSSFYARYNRYFHSV